MRWILYVIFGVVGLFLLIFIVGFVMAALTNKRRFSGYARTLFNELSSDEKIAVKKIWKAFKKTDANEANMIAKHLSKLEIEHLNLIFNPNLRPKHLSSGKKNDNAFWLSYINEAKKKGFKDTAAIVVAGVGLNGIDKFL